MKTLSLVVLLLLSAVPCFAQTDLAVQISGDGRFATLSAALGVHVTSSGLAENVVLELDAPTETVDVHEWNATKCTEGRPIRCTIKTKAEAGSEHGFFVYLRFAQAGTYTVTARVTSSTPDPNLSNNSATRSIVVAGLPDLRPYGRAALDEGYAVDPGGKGALVVGVQNDGAPATDAIVRVTLPAGGRFLAPDEWTAPYCTVVSDTEARCNFGDAKWVQQYRLPFIAPGRADGGTFPFLITVDAKEDDYSPGNDTVRGEVALRRLFAVTNAFDGGPGSLRQAILDSRDACETVPCILRVESEEPLAILPLTPLPQLRGRVKVDGGPGRTILDGVYLGETNGLHFEGGCEFRVDRMLIRNFKGHAIEAHQQHPGGYPCGVETLLATPAVITNNELISNVRGIVMKAMSATIADNVVRDHARAGIFVDGSYYSAIERNVVVANGAAGIFVHASNTDGYWLPPGADIIGNFVSGNREWGIARSAQGSVHIARNAIFRNGLFGIDYGLDLDTPTAPSKPRLHSAVYDASLNATIVRGEVQHGPGYSTQLDFYASSSLSTHGHPEAERWLGTFFNLGAFTVTLPGDLRGQWITATGERVIDMIFLRDDSTPAPKDAPPRYTARDTSELSNAVRVE